MSMESLSVSSVYGRGGQNEDGEAAAERGRGGAGGDVSVQEAAGIIWIVPRWVMCSFFWSGDLLLFTGLSFLIISPYKGMMFASLGYTCLGLGCCLLLMYSIFCFYTYCCLRVDVPQTPKRTKIISPPSTPRQNQKLMTSSFVDAHVTPHLSLDHVLSVTQGNVTFYLSDRGINGHLHQDKKRDDDEIVIPVAKDVSLTNSIAPSIPATSLQPNGVMLQPTPLVGQQHVTSLVPRITIDVETDNSDIKDTATGQNQYASEIPTNSREALSDVINYDADHWSPVRLHRPIPTRYNKDFVEVLTSLTTLERNKTRPSVSAEISTQTNTYSQFPVMSSNYDVTPPLYTNVAQWDSPLPSETDARQLSPTPPPLYSHVSEETNQTQALVTRSHRLQPISEQRRNVDCDSGSNSGASSGYYSPVFSSTYMPGQRPSELCKVKVIKDNQLITEFSVGKVRHGLVMPELQNTEFTTTCPVPGPAPTYHSFPYQRVEQTSDSYRSPMGNFTASHRISSRSRVRSHVIQSSTDVSMTSSQASVYDNVRPTARRQVRVHQFTF